MKPTYTKALTQGITAFFAVILVVIASFSLFSNLSAQTTSRTVFRGEFEPYVRSDAGRLVERVYYDAQTSTKVCQLMGYDTGVVASYSNWDSPSNNTAAYWNGSAWIQREGAKSGYMDAVRCSQTVAIPPIVASCSANPTQANVGSSVVFSTAPSGGTGSYTYSWSGTDGLVGNSSSVSRVYNTSGTKMASVVITSGSQSATANCSTQINTVVVPPPALVGSCTANYSQVYTGDGVTFSSSVSGGTGSYTYSWSGTDGLFGTTNSVNKSYTTTGTKTATVLIGSGSQSISRNCSVVVNPVIVTPPPPATLTGSCIASNTQVHVGDSVTFSASASGGTSVYSYSWTGSEGLFSGGPSATIAYGSTGTKTATVTITSGSQSIVRNCSTQVSAVVVTPDPVLGGSCVVNDTQVNIGDTVIFSASATGGNGNYTYTWSGSDSLSGNGQTVAKQYSTSGTKTASLIISSHGQSIVRNCSTQVNQVAPPNPVALTGSCIASAPQITTGDSVTFSASASGGNGFYTYSWSGTDGLSGNFVSVTKQYTTSGTKTATVTISSNGQSIVRNCSTQVSAVVVNDPVLTATCSSNYGQVNIGDVVVFSCAPTGGNGNYSYAWSGTDGLFGNTSSVTKSYGSMGTKTAIVTITSNGQTITRTATVQVAQAVVNDPALTGSCTANSQQINTGDSVVFTVNASGGNGSYNYIWTGTDGLSSSASFVTKMYNTPGTKTATVTIVSGNQTISRNCAIIVNQVVVNNPALTGACTANYSQANIGDAVTFNTSVAGGDGSYTYSWSGSEGLAGLGQSVTKSYSTTGTKTASVVISSAGQSITRNCTTQINQVTQNDPTVTALCMANYSQANIGDTVTFNTSVSGGNGNYTYAWSGTDSLVGSGQSVSRSYSTTGTKTASVTVTSNGQSAVANCSTNIIQGQTQQPNNLSGSCYAVQSSANIGDSVSFIAQANGGNGSYTYSWSGSDGLSGSGQSISRVYNTSGTKTASVIISSNGQIITQNCSTQINYTTGGPYYPNDPNQYNGLNASCSVNLSSAYVGDPITWYVTNATGGNGFYTYSWSGTDGLYGSGNSAYMTYNTPGTKIATVTLYSNGQSVSRTCTFIVNNRYTGGGYPGYTYPTYPQYPTNIVYPNTGYPTYPNNGVSFSADPGTGYVPLSQVPYTGLDNTTKIVLLGVGLVLWSFAVAYIFIIRPRRMSTE